VAIIVATRPRKGNGGEEFAISGLVMMKFLVGPIKRDDLGSRSRYDRYLAEFVQLPIDRPVFIDAAELRARHGLKTPDALHLATALSGGCMALWTNDQRLARAAGSFAVNIFSVLVKTFSWCRSGHPSRA